jgi:hypothetical protein
MRQPTDEYLEKAMRLSKEETERLMARMRRRFRRSTEDKDLSVVQALALQLEFEDEELAEWRQNVAKLREKHKK